MKWYDRCAATAIMQDYTPLVGKLKQRFGDHRKRIVSGIGRAAHVQCDTRN
jgi:hypothetical protein